MRPFRFSVLIAVCAAVLPLIFTGAPSAEDSGDANDDGAVVCLKTRNLKTHEVKLEYKERAKAQKRVEKYADSKRKEAVILTAEEDLCARAGLTPFPEGEDEKPVCVKFENVAEGETEYRYRTHAEAAKLGKEFARDKSVNITFLTDAAECEKAKNTPSPEKKPE